MSRPRCAIVPPHLLRHLALTRPDGAQRWQAALALDTTFRERRELRPPGARPGALALPPGPDWVVHTGDGTAALPGRPVRTAGEPATGDAAVDEAADGIAATLALLLQVWRRDSWDGAGASVSATVHHQRDYANAFWDGEQLVFGDGDGEVFGRFTAAVDVIAHELAHAVTERTAGLVYEGQSGALNESVSDVVGACLKQRVLGQRADQADWLVGAGLFLPGVRARGLRDMAAPGTAYDDPALGRDPQPADMAGYVETTDDNGGVHLNSGIPNRAFQLAATAIGGSSAEGAGRIWWAALTGDLDPRVDFAGFAAATVAAAGEHAQAVRTAWLTVGVQPGAGAGAAPGLDAPPAPGSTVVSVRRTGGVTGLGVDGSLDLDTDDDRVPEVRALLDRVDLAAVASGAPTGPGADRWTYDFDLCGDCARVPEQQLTPDLRRVADLLLP